MAAYQSIISKRKFATRRHYLTYLRTRRNLRQAYRDAVERRKKAFERLALVRDCDCDSDIAEFLNRHIDDINLLCNEFTHYGHYGYTVAGFEITSWKSKPNKIHQYRHPVNFNKDGFPHFEGDFIPGYAFEIKIVMSRPNPVTLPRYSLYDMDDPNLFRTDIHDIFRTIGLHIGGGGGNLATYLSYRADIFAIDFPVLTSMEALRA